MKLTTKQAINEKLHTKICEYSIMCTACSNFYSCPTYRFMHVNVAVTHNCGCKLYGTSCRVKEYVNKDEVL